MTEPAAPDNAEYQIKAAGSAAFMVYSLFMFLTGVVAGSFVGYFIAGLVNNFLLPAIGGLAVGLVVAFYFWFKYRIWKKSGIDGLNIMTDQLMPALKDQAETIKKYQAAMKEFRDREANKLTEFLNDYFQDTPITNHLMLFRNDTQPVLKIGTDELMVEVDTTMFQEDPIAALEKARLQWQTETKN